MKTKHYRNLDGLDFLAGRITLDRMEVFTMHMEFRRLTGKILAEREWPTQGVPIDELKMHCRDALMGFYTGNQHEFWPQEKYCNKAPEEVRIADASGNVVTRYDIRDIIADTHRSLVGIKDT